MNQQELYLKLCPKLIDDSTGCCYFAKSLLTLQMFANPKEGEKLHIMLVGDPGSGKTDMIQDVAQIVPNSRFLGTRKTGCGLEEAFVMCNGGIACVDELDKTDKKTRMSMLEVMQSQTVTVDQHQYHVQHPAKTNILAACNPRNDILQPGIPILKQVIFSIKEMTRFHLAVRFHAITSNRYSEIAVSMNRHGNSNAEQSRIEELKKYVTEARCSIPTVEISENLSAQVGQSIGTIKEMSNISEMISPRLIEGSLSLIKARARIMGRATATKEDFEYVYGILDRIYIKEE